MSSDSRNPSIMAGVMSGTSADGIDIAIIRMADGRPELLHFSEFPMPEPLRRDILNLAEPENGSAIDLMGTVDRALGELIAQAVLDAAQQAGIDSSEIMVIGSHGQTIRHRPGMHPSFTLQIGCPSTIAELTGITTVADFRRRDMAAGGQGAPLAPFIHRLLFARDDADTVVVNIGGIANVTWLGKNGDLLGFDTGPGNMVMDGLMRSFSKGDETFDADGRLAATGEVCEPLLAQLLQHPFLSRTPPKSCGREEFGDTVVREILAWPGLSDADRMRTALELTVRTIADSHRWMDEEAPAHWHICGGGTRNRFLMDRLAELLAPATVASTDAAGMPATAMEAANFAVLAWHTLRGTDNILPQVTGATHPVCGGHIVPGKNWPGILRDLPSWTR